MMKETESVVDMKIIYPEYALKDAAGTQDAACEQLDLLVDGCHVYGTIYTPSAIFGDKRPIVVSLHGFPGTSRMDDQILALRRCGCVVMTLYHRGAWGSDGKYLVSNCIGDAQALLDHIRSAEFTAAHHTDPDNIWLIGHSMGGNTAVNTAKNRPEVRGLILIAPFDPTLPERTGHKELFKEFLQIGLVMHTDGVDAMAEDVFSHPEYEFTQAVSSLKDRNIFLICGKYDKDASYERNARPFWEALTASPSDALHMKKEYPAGHGFDSVRTELAEDIAAFIAEAVNS